MGGEPGFARPIDLQTRGADGGGERQDAGVLHFGGGYEEDAHQAKTVTRKKAGGPTNGVGAPARPTRSRGTTRRRG